jgi:hypothetical protein
METTGQSANDEPGRGNLESANAPEDPRAIRVRLCALRAEDIRGLSDDEFNSLYSRAVRHFWNIPLVLTLEWLRRANECTRRGRKASDLDGYPVFLCQEVNDGTQWRFWCPWCAKHHTHGALYGHRVAHCHDHRSPFDARGYYVAGPADAPFIAHVRRRRFMLGNDRYAAPLREPEWSRATN